MSLESRGLDVPPPPFTNESDDKLINTSLYPSSATGPPDVHRWMDTEWMPTVYTHRKV